jgi:hypothetical protein
VDVVGDEVPVHNLPERFQVGGTGVAVVDVVGVLPHIGGVSAHGLADCSSSDIEGKFNQVAGLGLLIYVQIMKSRKSNDQEQLRVMQSQFP